MPLTLSQSEFGIVAEFAQQRWGLHLPENKARLVESRLTKHLVRSPFETLGAYIDHIRTRATPEELLELFDILSTNTTSFFREEQHFHYLRDKVYPALSEPGRPRTLRIWSGACSNGAEPYSLAMHVLEHIPDADRWDFKILATDLSRASLTAAREARYTPRSVDGIAPDLVRKYFHRVPADDDRTMQVVPEVRKRVSVHCLNLMDDWPMRGPFDIVFLRNVMIYFDRDTRFRLVKRIASLLSPSGVLAIGSAETLSGLDVGLRSVQPSVYMK